MSHMDGKRLKRLQYRYIETLKYKLGLPLTYSDAATFGPFKYGGVGVFTMEEEQDALGEENLIRQLRTPGKDRIFPNFS